MITLVGLMANFIALGVLLAHDTSFKAELPIWVQVLICLSIIFYETLDAVDGK